MEVDLSSIAAEHAVGISERFNLAGRRALVTGASRGIGRAIAEAMASAGADVALVGRDETALAQAAGAVEAAGRRAVLCPGDLADSSAAAHLVAQAELAIGPIDVLVHAAGTTARVPSAQARDEDFGRIMQVNAAAGMQLAQALGGRLIASGRPGAMVFVASLLTARGRPTVLHYAMSKTAMLGLIRTLAVEWGPHGIRVNGVAPGYVRTDLTRPLQQDERFNQWVLERTPMGRWGEPADIAPAAVFLASDAARFISGQVLYVDGGWTASL